MDYGIAITWMRGRPVHYEIFVEDLSGKMALEIIVPKIIGDNNTFKIYPYKGIGHIPKKLNAKSDVSKRILLDNLPRILNGCGKTYRDNSDVVIIIVCDLDNKCFKTFRKDLLDLLDSCEYKPNAKFCIAIEEFESWFLGDLDAIKNAYPKAKDAILRKYKNDDICGTWEFLAEAIYPGGIKVLSRKGYQIIGKEKSSWSQKISPYLNINENKSPSFCYFVSKLRELL